MVEPVLKAERIAKAFGAHQVLTDVRFQVGSDEIVGLLGPNGSGKSTLLNIVSGFSRPDAGQILFLGRSIGGLPSHKIARQGLVRTFQLPSMPHRMTVREVLRAGSREGAGLLDAFAGRGCDDAAPAGGPALFFLVRQSSTGCGTCATGDSVDPGCTSFTCASGCLQTDKVSNDVFGCGNF